jgi:predicted metal-dependent phosphoesterase TrpH
MVKDWYWTGRKTMGLADLHIHTIHSWDGTCAVSAVLQYAAHIGLSVIAITDHDEIKGALEAVGLAPSFGVEVVPGNEITTAEGHVLALFIRQQVPAGLSLIGTVLRVGELGGLCIAAHPMARVSGSLTAAAIYQALQHPQVGCTLVGVEAYNAGLVYSQSNRAAQALAQTLPVAQVGNSDAHMLWMIGRGTTEFSGSTASQLRRALEEHATRVVKGQPSGALRIISTWVPRYLLRRAGWVDWTPAPHTSPRLSRLAHVHASTLALMH